MSTLNLFDAFEFERVQNRDEVWHESLVMEFLGYKTRRSFQKAVQRAMKACLSIHINVGRDFVPLADGTYSFTRSACYLISMHADSKKPQVAAAQAYFIWLGKIVQEGPEHFASIERILFREEMTDGMKALAKTAKTHGVVDYAMLMNEGYHGMYNMPFGELTKLKGVPFGEKLIDRMGRTELAANMFRVTQTDEKIKNDDSIIGQAALESVAHEVGVAVREAMYKISKTRPEDLPIVDHIDDAKKEFKAAAKRIRAVDRLPKGKRMLDTLPDPAGPPDQPHPRYTSHPEDEDE